jgi:hypothetical protein
MVEAATVEVQQLIQQGRAAVLAGDTLVARTRFRRATELDPSCAEAWVGLSSAVPILAEKQECLRRALAIDPATTEAQAALRYIEQLMAEGLRIAPSRRPEERAPADTPPPSPDVPAAASAVGRCYNHPDLETGLHCVQCAQPICGKCVRMAPVGQLCPKCRRGRRPQQYKVSAAHLVIAGVVTLVVSALAAGLMQFVMGGFVGFYVAFFAGPMVAEVIVRIIDRLTRAKRGRAMQIVVATAMVLAILPFALLWPLLMTLFLASGGPDAAAGMSGMAPALLSQVNGMMLIYMAIAVATAVARLT